MWFKFIWFQVWNESDRITHRGDLFFKYCTFEFKLLFAQGFFLLLFSGKTAPPPSKKPVGRPPNRPRQIIYVISIYTKNEPISLVEMNTQHWKNENRIARTLGTHEKL